jgi:hypothetical protein
MYVWRHIEELPLNHCCFGKAMSITYSECVFVALFIQHVKVHAPYYIVICDLSVLLYFDKS